jgi:glutamate dehydrogenase/leucine dehydrogenase
MWRYPDWRDGLDDALRLSAGMTLKCAVAGVASGGGKTVVAVPEGLALDPATRAAALRDVGDLVESLGGRYATGPDAGTSPEDMVVVGERTRHVFCTPRAHGGGSDSAPATAVGVVAALRAVCARIPGPPGIRGRRLAIVGLGSVGGHLARLLTEAGASLLVSDVDPGKRALADELGADWAQPAEALAARADVLIPAALGGVLTAEVVPRLRCAAIAGPANNQLAEPAVAGLLHRRGILWAPDYVVGAGGVIYALAVELHSEAPDKALARVRGIEDTLGQLLDGARLAGVDPARAALDVARQRLAGP